MSQLPHPLLVAIEGQLASSPKPAWDAVLERITRHFECPVGTVHLLDAKDGMLHLTSQRGLPPPVLDKVQVIPIGKGMAGIAAERREPVQVCNLQSDQSGVVRPGAKLTQMEGSLAAPMLAGDVLCGVLGIAKPVAYDFSEAETKLLMDIGTCIARRLHR
ncbi:MAG: GAF domain-containing protein [Planctomycetota bacterium]